MKLNSREEAKEGLRQLGIPISRWARTRGFEPEIVYAVLAGRAEGNWGESHRVAIALGIKPRPGERKIPRPIADSVDGDAGNNTGEKSPPVNRR